MIDCKKYFVYCFVVCVFYGEVRFGLEVVYINGDGYDNCLVNLMYVLYVVNEVMK